MAHVAKVDAEIGLLARFLQGRKWYGVEWYMTVIGGFIVVFIVVLTLLTFFTPRLAPYDPEGMVGDPFTPPARNTSLAPTNWGAISLAESSTAHSSCSRSRFFRLSSHSLWEYHWDCCPVSWAADWIAPFRC